MGITQRKNGTLKSLGEDAVGKYGRGRFYNFISSDLSKEHISRLSHATIIIIGERILPVGIKLLGAQREQKPTRDLQRLIR